MLTAVFIFVASIQLASLRNISFDINGGKDGHIENFTFAVSLFIEWGDEETPNKGEGCGASIINQLILLTAAHCVWTTADKVEAYTGHPHMWDGTLKRIKLIRAHPWFNERSFDRDLALLEVEKPFELGRFLGRVALLPEWKHLPVVVVGFGSTNVEKGHGYLRFAEQRILTRSACRRRVKRMNEGTFCAMWPSGYPAYNDAGSALVQDNFIQAGLVSYVDTPDDSLAIYTNVTFFHHFITRIAKGMTCGGVPPEDSSSDSKGSWETAEEDQHGWYH